MAVSTKQSGLSFGSSIELRPYQSAAVDFTWDWISKNPGNLCLESPGGTGKSVIIAELCKQAVQSWGAKILMLVAQKELLEQNSKKMRSIWQNALMGLYSASVNRREIDAITFASVQSIYSKAEYLGHRDLVIVDEADLISHHDEGMYRDLFRALTAINPNIRIIGLTATPFRMSHGILTDKPAIFDFIHVVISIEDAVAQGYLAPLVSRRTKEELSVKGVHMRGGDFIPKELQAAVDIEEKTLAIVKEVIENAEGRLHWLVFCTGVDHAEHVRDAFRALGVTCETVTGKTPKEERESILRRYMAGEITCLTNAFVLSRGFDYPDIDLVVDMAPTKSPARYIQKVVRGMRLKSHAKDCRVMDFAGNIAEHGPITAVRVPGRYVGGDGIPPSKSCPECGEICATAARVCPACGNLFPEPKKEALALRNDDIMGREPSEMEIESWSWTLTKSKTSQLPMIRVNYYGNVGAKSISEFLCLWHDGFAGQKASRRLKEIADGCHVPWEELQGDDATQRMESAYPPRKIFFRMEGKWPRIVGQEWAMAQKEEDYDPEEIPF